MNRLALFCACLTVAVTARAQNIEYGAAVTATAGSGDAAPFWFTSNRYGLGSTEPNSGMARAWVIGADSLRRNWHIAYGLDAAAAINHQNTVTLQQAYVDARWKVLQLSVGQKERPLEMKHQRLSSGALTNGINARPVPQVRAELADFWTIPRTRQWVAIKGHLAYGWFTDNQWQANNAGTNGHYAADILYHSKAGYLRIGNEQRCPFTFTGAFEACAQFGGRAWSVHKRDDDTSDFDGSYVTMDTGMGAFLNAFFMGGYDPSDGSYSNVEGNHLGSWQVRGDWNGGTWRAAFYAEHFFEDHSQLFLQYAWKDMLYGGELHLPANRLVSTVVVEHLRTTHQSGSIYHDHTDNLPDQLSATDNYYNHTIYTGWHHAGYTMGNPLLISPVYKADGDRIFFEHNRVTAWHVGAEGDPWPWLSWRALATVQRSLGTYSKPLTDPQRGRYFLAEATYRPARVPGLALTAAYGHNGGDLLGSSRCAMMSIQYTGHIKRRR